MLNDYKPTWQDRLVTPGMMIRPRGDQLEITFSVSETESWGGFVHNLNTFLSPYNDSYQVQTNDYCPPDQYFIQEDSGEVRNNPKRSCQFNRTMLDDCSGVSDRFYGYSRGQPCILIKLNRDRLVTPGMMIRPKGDQLEITFSVSETESWGGFVHNLNTFLSPYNDSYQVQTNDYCPPDQYFIQEDSGEVRNNPKRSCQFNRTMLDGCSGVSDRFYGYSRGQPCILIKLNRTYRVGKDEWREDSDKMGQLVYYPPNGTFNLMYYPYYGKKAQVNYTQPLVAVKFLNASLNTDISVECKINSNTLAPGSERDKFAGRVSFKLRINDK